MRHLRILEDAGLVHTRKVGRERHHYLNAIPIQTVYDRWVEPFARPTARALTALKRDLEMPMTSATAVPKMVLEIHIETTPEKLWNALVDPDMTQQYYFGSRFESDVEAGAPFRYTSSQGAPLLDGEVVEAKPYERLVMTFRPLMNLEEGGDPSALNISRTTFEITQEGPTCKLVLVHDELTEADSVAGYFDGWSRILSGLKTLLEQGRPMQWGEPETTDAV